jgi:N-acetylmuramoyl-L-alanine amidase
VYRSLNLTERAVALLVFFLSSSCGYAGTAKVINVQLFPIESATRIVVTLNQPVPYHIFTLSNPNRLVIDVEQTRLAISDKHLQFNNANIKSVRMGFPSAKISRLVFDLNQHLKFKVWSEPADSRIVIDLVKAEFKKKSVLPKILKTNLPIAKTIIIPPTHVLQSYTIVIDAGHGGKDPGATGILGTKEKNVVLAIAKQLADLVNQQPNMHAILTRNGDYFVPLRDRIRLARSGNADLFIAIHADSFLNDHSSGVSVFALSPSGATSEAARWLATSDNHSELGNVDLKELGDQSYVLRSVLIDMAQTATISASLHLGKSLLTALNDVTNLHYPQVEQAPFVVLKSPDIPSVLVEIGFISNASEELRLRDPTYQAKLAQALFAGAKMYFKKYPQTST